MTRLFLVPHARLLARVLLAGQFPQPARLESVKQRVRITINISLAMVVLHRDANLRGCGEEVLSDGDYDIAQLDSVADKYREEDTLSSPDESAATCPHEPFRVGLSRGGFPPNLSPWDSPGYIAALVQPFPVLPVMGYFAYSGSPASCMRICQECNLAHVLQKTLAAISDKMHSFSFLFPSHLDSSFQGSSNSRPSVVAIIPACQDELFFLGRSLNCIALTGRPARTLLYGPRFGQALSFWRCLRLHCRWQRPWRRHRCQQPRPSWSFGHADRGRQ